MATFIQSAHAEPSVFSHMAIVNSKIEKERNKRWLNYGSMR